MLSKVQMNILLNNYNKIGLEFSDAVVNEEINRSNAIGENLDLAQNALNNFEEKTGITIATLQSEETRKNAQELPNKSSPSNAIDTIGVAVSTILEAKKINGSPVELESAIERQRERERGRAEILMC